MDLRLKLNTGETVNVEMQAFAHKGFSKRILFYWAKNYIFQLKEGEKYQTLCPSYSLIFSSFNLFTESQKAFYNSFSIRSDKAPYFNFSKDLRLVTVELSKFKAGSGPATLRFDFRDLWCYILKHSRSIGEREWKELKALGPEMEEAMTYLRKFSLEEQQQILAEAKEKNRRDQMAREDYVFDQGMEKGMQQVALNMLKNKFKLSVISEMTGLSEEKINLLGRVDPRKGKKVFRKKGSG